MNSSNGQLPWWQVLILCVIFTATTQYWRNVGKKDGKVEFDRDRQQRENQKHLADEAVKFKQKDVSSKVSYCSKCGILLNVATKKCLVCDLKANKL